MRDLRLGPVYPITAVPNRHRLDHAGLAKLFVASGVTLFQIREKQAGAAEFFRQVQAAVSLAVPAGCQVIVNDRLDIALAVGAAGVHLGWDDLPAQAARTVTGDRLVIGLSTHTPQQFRWAQDLDVDYVAIGPVRPSRTKAGPYPPLGVEGVLRLVPLKRHPVVAIGGIDLEVARTLWRGGVDAVAVISDVVDASDPVARIRAYQEAAREP